MMGRIVNPDGQYLRGGFVASQHGIWWEAGQAQWVDTPEESGTYTKLDLEVLQGNAAPEFDSCTWVAA